MVGSRANQAGLVGSLRPRKRHSHTGGAASLGKGVSLRPVRRAGLSENSELASLMLVRWR
ncbi:hypothetical protein SAMN04487952_1255 [Halomonas caseinilytica]|nr:hypothetical protein SAMN04487952_1255 [Halomonas caseinilytica]